MSPQQERDERTTANPNRTVIDPDRTVRAKHESTGRKMGDDAAPAAEPGE